MEVCNGMKRITKRLIIVSVVIAALTLTHSLWLPLFAKFLIVKDNLAKADAILVLSGDWNFDRADWGIRLYKKDYADKIILIIEREDPRWFSVVMKMLLHSDLTQKEAVRRYYETQGVPRKDLIFGRKLATSTFDELHAAKDMIEEHKFKSVILVTSGYHMRRVLMTAKRVLVPAGIDIYNATVSLEGYYPGTWWLHESDTKHIFLEYLSIAFYIIYHFTLGR